MPALITNLLASSLVLAALAVQDLDISHAATEDIDKSQALAYLGVGYNVITGDPHSNGQDPGWMQAILKRSWVSTQLDWVYPVHKCTFDAITTTVSGGKSAQESMKKEWQVSGSVGLFSFAKVAFTSSNSVTSMNKSSWTDKQHFQESRASCQILSATLPSFVSFTFAEGFANLVKQLPTNYTLDAEEWIVKNLIGNFGTHYPSKLASGGMTIQRSSMSESSYETLFQKSIDGNWDIDVGAQGSFWAFADPSGKVSHKVNKDATDAFNEAIQSGTQKEFFQGGALIQGDPQAWYDSLLSAMVPVGSDINAMAPVSDLLVNTHFHDDPAIDQKRAVVEKVMARVCHHFRGCTENPRDRFRIPPATIPEGSNVLAIAWSKDGGNITSGSSDNYVRQWDVLTQKAVWSSLTTDRVNSVAYSPDGAHVASGDNDGTIQIRDAATGKFLQTLTGHESGVNSVAFSPDGAHLASCSSDVTIRIWDAVTGNCLQTLTGHTDYVESVAYSPDGAHLASGGDNTSRIWDAVTGNCLQTLTGHKSAVISVAYSPDGARLASGSLDKTIRIWDMVTGSCLQTLTGHKSGVTSVAYSPDGAHLASGSDDKTIRIWDSPSTSGASIFV